METLQIVILDPKAKKLLKNLVAVPILYLFGFQFAFGQADNWNAVVTDGFGLPNQAMVPEMEEFNGKLFASTSPKGAGIAKLWYSSSGNSGSWTQVTNFNPPLSFDFSIHSFGTTTLNGGIMWLGTGNNVKGAIIYRSTDGISWTSISKRGFGTPALTGAVPHMVVFQGTGDTVPYIYAGAMSHGAGTPGQVWRTPITNTDSTQWTKLVDFATIDPGVQTVAYFCVWNDSIYFGTDDNNGGGQLWQSTDGVNFTKNTFVGGGFGDMSNHVLSSIEVFNNAMHITTTNIQGGELWRSTDGVNWQQITSNAFGKSDSVNELRSLRTSFNKLWVTGYTDTSVSKGTPVWRSSDGINWVQSNTDGFGNTNNNGANAVTIGFGNYQYLGGPNYTDGGQIWRTDMTTGINESDTKCCSINIFPNPFSSSTTLQTDDFLHNATLTVDNCFGQTVAQIKNISGQTITFNHDNLPSGLYFIRLTEENKTIAADKLVIADK